MLCQEFIRLSAEFLIEEQRHLEVCPIPFLQTVKQDILRLIDLAVVDHCNQLSVSLHHFQWYFSIIILIYIFVKNELDKRAYPFMDNPHHIILIFQHFQSSCPLLLISCYLLQ